MPANKIAFVGYSRAGKTECAKCLDTHKLYSFGDVIKTHLNEFVWQRFGFSAFTEIDSQKSKIRPLLETYGDCNYDVVFNEYFMNLPEKCVNGRLVRVREAEEWRLRGGRIYEIVKPYTYAATKWEEEYLAELRRARVIDGLILNNGTLEQLRSQVLSLS